MNEYTGDELNEYSSWNRKHFETYYETLDDNWNKISDFFIFYEVRKYLKNLKIELTKEEFNNLCAGLYNDFYMDYIDDSPFFEFEKEIYDLPYNEFVKLGEKERKIMERNNKECTFEEMNEKLKYIKD